MSGEASSRQDARTFLAEYESAHPDDVVRVDDEVPADQGVTALVTELQAEGRAPILVCSKVSGVSGVAVVTNLFASRERIGRMLGGGAADLHERFAHASARAMPVRAVVDGPVLEVRREGDEVDLAELPMLTHFAEDAAPYLTSAIVVAQDPRTGAGNLSYHRAMVTSRNTLATSLHSRGHLWRMLAAAGELGQPLPVAVVIGGHPLFMLAAAARVGFGEDEREIAGGLFGEPLEVVPTHEHGIGVPATGEIVLEGTVDASEHQDEGPFGEYSGYASARSTNNVIRVTSILRRADPWLIDVVSGNAPDHLNLGRVPRESELVAKLRARFPDLVALEYPASGTHFHCYVSVRPSMPGIARQVALALLGWDPYLKLVVVVDDDVDVRDQDRVLWALATRFQADRDSIVVSGVPGSVLDPSSSGGVTSRMALDATKKPGFDARSVSLSEAAVTRAREILNSVGR
jgi:UbiD family decarboxylase